MERSGPQRRSADKAQSDLIQGSRASGFNAMNRVLVTGASGFIGSHSLSILQNRGYEVHAVWLKNRRELDGVEWHRADLLDPASIGGLIREVRPTHLLHLAWYAVPRDYRESPENLAWCKAGISLLTDFAEGGGRRAVFAWCCF